MQNARELLLSARFFRRAQASYHIFQKGRMWFGFQQPRKALICFTRKPVPGDSPSASSHQFGAFTAPAAMDLEANGMLPSMLLNKQAFLTQCLRSANSSNKSTICRAVNKAAHYSDRENQQYEKAVPYVTTEITCTPYLLPLWLHCYLEKSVCRRV